ncbi:MAG: hypothetical protein IV094_18935 [Vitreoscilla sp.]|nr:hypothetical protein [Vitreoscilla sp.]
MKNLSVMLAIAASACAAAQAAPPSKYGLIECTVALCGGAPEDTGLYVLRSGWVNVAPGGETTVSVRHLFERATGTTLAFKRLELHYARPFGIQTGAATYVGHFTTDADGNYRGPVFKAVSGQAVQFSKGERYAGTFVVTDPIRPSAGPSSLTNPQLIAGFEISD